MNSGVLVYRVDSAACRSSAIRLKLSGQRRSAHGTMCYALDHPRDFHFGSGQVEHVDTVVHVLHCADEVRHSTIHVKVGFVAVPCALSG